MTKTRKTQLELKGKRPSFEDIALGHTFKLIGTHSLEGDERFHCAFCGGRGRHFCLIERDDGENYQVGASCLQRVGLVKKAGTAKLKKLKEDSKPTHREQVEKETIKKKLEDADVNVATDVEYDEDFFDEILKELEN